MRSRNVALIIALAGIAVLLFGLLTPITVGSTDGGANGGSDSERTVYTVDNAVIMMIGAFICGAGLSFYAFKEDYVPVPSSAAPPSFVQEPTTITEGPVVESGPGTSGPSASGEDMLVLRLLNGDERQMYRTIVGLGGSALQKDLIVKTKMSDAKVSRVIDRLIEKGLVKKERYGVTNRITISIEK